MIRALGCIVLLGLANAQISAQDRPERARDLGIPLEGEPGPLNAITDVPGVAVGHTTIVKGSGRLRVGIGPVRTGVTAIFPRGRDDLAPAFAGIFSLNGNGEMTGSAWIEDYGMLVYPIAITNTNSVGTVRDALIEWDLNDIFGFHVKKADVDAALATAAAGRVAEGNVGGGTGMICLGFKGGIGTASRRIEAARGRYTVGVLVQCNFGERRLLRIAGVPVGHDLFIAFSTARIGSPDSTGVVRLPTLSDAFIDPVYEPTVQGTEEAIINAMLAARTMKGADDFVVPALSHDRPRQVLASHYRLRR